MLRMGFKRKPFLVKLGGLEESILQKSKINKFIVFLKKQAKVLDLSK